MHHPPLIGVDVGGTHVRAGVVVDGSLTWEYREATHLAARCREVAVAGPSASHEGAPALVVSALAAVVRRARSACPEAVGAGLAVPGFFATRERRLMCSPNLPGLEDVDLVGPLRAALDGFPVTIENDALSAAWGEWTLLGADASRSLLYAGLGTGVGGGLVLDGRPWRGAHGFGTELGHVCVVRGGRACGCGKRGCLEQYASATAVAGAYRERTESADADPSLDAGRVAALAREGDPAARAAFDEAGQALGTGVAQVLTLLDVADVVVGGGMAQAYDLLERPFAARLAEDALPVLAGRFRVVPSTAGDRAGVLGAAFLAFSEMET